MQNFNTDANGINNNSSNPLPSSLTAAQQEAAELDLLLSLGGGDHQHMQHPMQMQMPSHNTPLWVDGNMAQTMQSSGTSQFGMRGPASMNNLTPQQQQIMFMQQQHQQQQPQRSQQQQPFNLQQMLHHFPEHLRKAFYVLAQELDRGQITNHDFNISVQQLMQQSHQQHAFNNNNTNMNANPGSSMLGGSTMNRSSASKPNASAGGASNKRGGASSSSSVDPLQQQQPPMKKMRNDPKLSAQQQQQPKVQGVGGRSAATSSGAGFSMPTAAPSRSQTALGGSNQEVELDIEDMMDVTNYAGVDLKQEEFSMNDMGGAGGSSQQYTTAVDQPFLNPHKVEEFVMSHQMEQYGGLAGTASAGFIEEIDEQFLSFMDAACQLYMTQLIESMVAVSEARMTVDYNVFKDTAGLVDGGVALDVEERGDDIRGFLVEMEQREGVEMNGLIGSVGFKPEPEEEEEVKGSGGVGDVSVSTSAATEGGGGKRKSGGSGIKKDLPEAMKSQLTNYAAMLAVGGTVKSWMLPGGSMVAAGPAAGAKGVPPPSIMRRPAPPSSFQDLSATGSGSVSTRTGARGTGNRIIQKRVTIKDALTVLEGQKHLKSSEFLYRWLANIK